MARPVHSLQQRISRAYLAVPSASRWATWGVFVLICFTVLGITLLHYLTSAHLLPYHSIYRSLYYLPIAGAAIYCGMRAGLLTALVVSLLYLPHILGIGETIPGGMVDNLLELLMFFLVGGLGGWLADRERAQRYQTEALRAYMDSVLQSLPLGVAATDEAHQLTPRNRGARSLLESPDTQAVIAALGPGYHTVETLERPLGVHVSPLRQPDGQPRGQVYVLEDLTERRSLEAQMRRIDRLASVGQLAAGVAHEIRNPLAILRATVQLMHDRLQDQPAFTTPLHVLTSEADRIDRLIGELLDYARPRPPVWTRLDLADMLAAAASEVQAYALQHGITIVVEAPRATSFCADEQQIHQVIINLLLNAIQASSPGATVYLTGTGMDQEVQLCVRDSGCGMPPEVQERACDPFFTTRTDGTGLGLAIVAAAITEHQGALRIDSEVGRGTAVTVTLPRRDDYGPRAHR